MKKNNLKRFLASLLAVLMLASATGMSPAVFAEWGDSARAGIGTLAAKSGEKIVLNGESFEIKIPYKNGSIDYDTLYQTIFDTCVNVSESTPKSREQVEIGRYFSPGIYPALEGATIFNKTYGSIEEDKTYEVRFQYKVSAWKSVNATCDITFIGRDEAPFTVAVPDQVNLIFKDGTTINYSEMENAIRALVTSSDPTVSAEDITVKYDAALTGLADRFKPLDNDQTGTTRFGEGTFKIELTWAGNDQYKPFEWTNDIKFVDNRIQSTIVFKENATITYNMDAAAQKEAIIKNAIDYEQSKLPAETDVDDFTVKINGKEIPNAKLDAGENQTIYISYNGNTDYKPCKDAERTINVEKANVKVSMKRFTTVYAGQDINKDVLKVALDPNDPAIDVYLVFAGINTKLDTSVNLVLTKEQWTVIENISKVQQFIFDNDKIGLFKDKTTLQQKLEKGMTIGEFKAYMFDFIDALEKATQIPGIGSLIKAEMEKYGISIDSLKAMATIFDKLTAFSDDTQIALGAPKHAGLYTAFALAVNKNYNTGVANGIVLIAMNTAGMKLVPNADIKGKNIDAETAKQMRETGTPALVTLYCGDSAENVDQSSIHYWFTGVNTIYAGSKMPTKPGKYIVTASVYGGDYLAPPVTFTFRIIK